ncbi:ribonuclease HII [Salibacterium aidingense]|uniref:ribonuclease HII n=1 Tax=Salibacterium aidingense TaxID=384933 RepID=UPI0003FD5754|nr:ribonuclease HII [Salibacterium aidingense]
MMNQETIAEIKHRLFQEIPEESWLEELRKDQRKGVQQLLTQFDKRAAKQRQLELNFAESLHFEKKCTAEGCRFIAGVDEVGRGPLAGPVTAAAAVLPVDCSYPGLTDSKKLSREQREYFYEKLVEETSAYSIVHVPASDIDNINIYQASIQAMKRAVEGLKVAADALLIDAVRLPLPTRQIPLTKGDQRSASIAAASVLAKVERDRYMENLAEVYPEYGFEKNMGYGTEIHLDALQRLGPIPEHRRSFSPVKQCL